MCGTRGTFFKDQRRGAVLILVLFVLTGLSVLTVEFSRDILLDHAMSTSTRSILAAKPLMESGERLATAVLTRNSEAGTPDHVREDWGLFGLGLERLSAELPGADLSGSIEDENSRFPINAIFYEREADRARAEAFADILTRLLAGLMRVHGYAGGPDNALALAKEYVNSLRQWGGQTETDQDTLKWYLTQTPRYLPPGRPLLAPEEILLVRWPHVEQEWGRDVLRGTKELPGLLETLTIWTQGPMNMNTLQPAVLSALVRDERQARPFVNAVQHYRDNPDNDLGENWYKDLLSAYDVPALPNGCLDVRSRWYRLNLTVQQGARKICHVGIPGRALMNAARLLIRTLAPDRRRNMDNGHIRQRNNGGFTLLELMIVIVILGILGAIVAPKFMDEPHKARVVQAKMQIENLSTAVKKFYLDNGFYPSTEQGLEALVTRPAIGKTPKNYPANGYITKIPKDPWGNDYVYTAPGQKVPFEIMSLGSDGAEGGEGEAADIWGEDVPDR